eukprot:5392480-Lingulodinium_polyedra.AAC.1
MRSSVMRPARFAGCAGRPRRKRLPGRCQQLRLLWLPCQLRRPSCGKLLLAAWPSRRPSRSPSRGPRLVEAVAAQRRH